MVRSNIRKIMTINNVTVLQLSTETGIASETIMRARGDKISKCKLETLEIISNYFQISIKDLFEEE